MKIRSEGAAFYRADGWTDPQDECNSRFFSILRTCLKIGGGVVTVELQPSPCFTKHHAKTAI